MTPPVLALASIPSVTTYSMICQREDGRIGHECMQIDEGIARVKITTVVPHLKVYTHSFTARLSIASATFGETKNGLQPANIQDNTLFTCGALNNHQQKSF